MVLKAGLVALIVALALFGKADGTCVSANHVNGCSIPLNAPFPYKTKFTPACHRHDVCYHCGQRYGWSRADCDLAFKRDMESICDSFFTSRKRSLWTHAENTWKVAQEILAWPFITKQLAHCKQGAKIYYMSVDYFGASSYPQTSPSWCSNTCVISTGSPAGSVLKK